LYNGTRASKTDPVFFALGDTDELNANIGLALAHCTTMPGLEGDEKWKQLLERLSVIQSRLLDAGTAIATPLNSSRADQLARAAFPEAAVTDLETWIDDMEDQLPVLRNFILPVGEGFVMRPQPA
jgi:cob(I)alamin adenosyltransferase